MRIVFIRHGEKTKSDPVHLSLRGRRRAALLVDYFMQPQLNGFQKPEKFVAMSHTNSHRCVETLEPVARKMDCLITRVHRSVTLEFAKRILAMRPTKDHPPILCCWEHSRIVDMVNALGAATVTSWGLDPESEADQRDCFDATWVCEIDHAMHTLTMKVFRQFCIGKDGEPFYETPREHVFYRHTWAIS